jgi:hypothetical protein
MSLVDRAPKAAKRALFSPAVFAQIAKMVDGGFKPSQIAATIGCTLGTLRVRCSQCGVSLRRYTAESIGSRTKLMIKLPPEIALRLQLEAQKQRISPTKLATILIETIVQDELYGAVIDRKYKRCNGGEYRSTRGTSGRSVPRAGLP